MALNSILVLIVLFVKLCFGQFHWQTRDSFDEIRKQIDSVIADNCKVVDINELFLPHSSVTHIPDLKWLGIDPIFPNRTNLLHIHNMALSRAFYLRYFSSQNCVYFSFIDHLLNILFFFRLLFIKNYKYF
jgi:hypothetical protein